MHLALFVPWERFRGEPADDIPGLWQRFEESLSDRVRSYVRNIALLRVSAEDARIDSKLQGMDPDFEEVVDIHAVDSQGEEGGDSAGTNGGNIDPEEYCDAVLNVLSAVRESEIKSMPMSSALRCLVEDARAVDVGLEDSTAAQRGRQFYTMLQDIQDSPFRGMGLLSREEVDAISKLQRKEDARITADIQGKDVDESSANTARLGESSCIPSASRSGGGNVTERNSPGAADASRSRPVYVVCRCRSRRDKAVDAEQATVDGGVATGRVPRRARHATAGRGGQSTLPIRRRRRRHG